jgi:hypothetical protein
MHKKIDKAFFTTNPAFAQAVKAAVYKKCQGNTENK